LIDDVKNDLAMALGAVAAFFMTDVHLA